MPSRYRSAWLLGVLALVCFCLRWPIDNYTCNPDKWHSSTVMDSPPFDGKVLPWRPPASEGATFFSSVFRGGGGTPAIFAMFGGQRYLVANILWNYSDVLFHQGKPYDMVYPLESAVALNPRFIDAWSVYGWHLAWNLNTYTKDPAKKQKWLLAGESVDLRAVQANPDNPRPCFDLSWLYLQRMGNYDKAEKWLKYVVEGKDKHGAMHFQPISAADKKGLSITDVDLIRDRKWDPFVFGHRLAYVYKKQGIIHTGAKGQAYFKKAIATYDLCLKLDPADKVATSNKNELLDNMENQDWIAKQRAQEDQIRKNYGMTQLDYGNNHSPSQEIYGQ